MIYENTPLNAASYLRFHEVGKSHDRTRDTFYVLLPLAPNTKRYTTSEWFPATWSETTQPSRWPTAPSVYCQRRKVSTRDACSSRPYPACIHQPEDAANHNHETDGVHKSHDTYPGDIRRKCLPSEIVDKSLVEDGRSDHEEAEGDNLDDQTDDHHSLPDRRQVLNHQEARRAALHYEGKDVAADE
jgi:hypothetical protein